MMRALLFLVLLLMGYMVAIVIAGWPLYPLIVAGIFAVTLFATGAPQKALLLFLVSMGLVGYHFAVQMAQFPLWPVQAFAAGCVIMTAISVVKGRTSAAPVGPSQ